MSTGRMLATLVLLALATTPAIGQGRRGSPDSMSVGDPAFATRLASLDGKSEFDLARAGGKPVAFVFGSYT